MTCHALHPPPFVVDGVQCLPNQNDNSTGECADTAYYQPIPISRFIHWFEDVRAHETSNLDESNADIFLGSVHTWLLTSRLELQVFAGQRIDCSTKTTGGSARRRKEGMRAKMSCGTYCIDGLSGGHRTSSH